MLGVTRDDEKRQFGGKCDATRERDVGQLLLETSGRYRRGTREFFALEFS